MRNLKIAAAVSAALLSTGAFALTPAEVVNVPAGNRLVVAGASAARDTFASEFLALCASNAHFYRAFPTTNADFRAYTCRLLGAAPVPVALRNQDVVVYYRSEGGSVWGPGAIAKGINIQRLDVTATGCSGTGGTGALVAAPAFNDCNSVSYGGLVTDANNGAHLVRDNVDLGVADEEPAMYRGENWAVGLYLHTQAGSFGVANAEPNEGTLEGTSTPQLLSSQIGFGQVFGVLVNSGLSINSISKQDVASIYQGAYSDWSQVQDQATGAAAGSGPIAICRREAGSGTQASAGIYFLNQNCGVSFEPFVTAPSGPNGNPVFEHGTTTALEGCVGTTAGAIGPNVYKSPAPSGTKYLAIDGVSPSKVNAARGTYGYAFESSFSKSVNPALSGNTNALADLLIARARATAGIPGSSASAYAVPNIAGNSAAIPVAIAGTPVAVGTKSGNSCKTQLGQN